MCGIAGVIGDRTGIRNGFAAAMSATIAHRGPDDCGVWTDDEAVLIHRRLSIIDLSQAGHQPMVSHCGRYVMVYNGEVYNYRELRDDLVKGGVQLHGDGDSEVLLAAYLHYGVNCLTRLNGMWAVAIWDSRESTLFMSRDRFGKKPFYYAINGRRFIFASEIKAILATGLVAARPNPSAVADFCAERASDHTNQTFFQGIHQLLPGTWGLWRSGELRTFSYWRLPDDDNSVTSPNIVAEIKDLLADSVKLRLRADTPLGTLLSGGIDSSAVTCLAALHHPRTVNAFSTIGANPPEEAAGIRQVTDAHPNVTLRIDQPDENTLVEELDACLWHQEEPFADGSMLAHFRLMRVARAAGVKVLLTGQGADEVFAGYPGHLAAHAAGLIASGAWLQARSFMQAVHATGQRLSIQSALGYALPTRLAKHARRRRVRQSVDWLEEEVADVSPQVEAGVVDVSQADPLNGTLRQSISQRTLPGFLHYEDRNSMAFGLETRAPFLDHRLVSKVLPLAGGLKVRCGLTKSLLRDAIAPVLPSSIVSRTAKQGYPAPLAQWLRSSNAAVQSTWVPTIEACPLIRTPHWHRRHRLFLAGQESELTAVWRGLVLALWYDRFVIRSLCN